jgi:archaemetzincin
MLKALLRARPASVERILGVTGRDLFIPVLSFVFGQAQVDGPAAVVSLARISPAFSGLPEDRPLLVARARKEALHELGHTFGLVHCPEALCPMSLSTSVFQVDRKGEAFCASCAALLGERNPAAAPEGRNR